MLYLFANNTGRLGVLFEIQTVQEIPQMQNITFFVEIQRALFYFKTGIQIKRNLNIDIAARWKPISIFPISIYCSPIY